MKVNQQLEKYSSLNEQIHLKNVIQTKGFFGFKKRFGVLTNERLILFESKEDYLVGKNPRKSFSIKEFEYLTEGREMHIYQTLQKTKMKLIKKLFFPRVELCIQWWDTMKIFKHNHLPTVKIEESLTEIQTDSKVSQRLANSKELKDKIMNEAKTFIKNSNIFLKKKNNKLNKKSRNCSFEIIGHSRKNDSIEFKESKFNINIDSVKDIESKEDPMSFKHYQNNENYNFSNSSFKINSEGQTKLQLVINNFSERFRPGQNQDKTNSDPENYLSIENSNRTKNDIRIFQNNSRDQYINNYRCLNISKISRDDKENDEQVSKFNVEDIKSNSDKIKFKTENKNKKEIKLRMLDDQPGYFRNNQINRENFINYDKNEEENTNTNCNRNQQSRYEFKVLKKNQIPSNEIFDQINQNESFFRNAILEKNSRCSIIKEITESSENKESKKSNDSLRSKESQTIDESNKISLHGKNVFKEKKKFFPNLQHKDIESKLNRSNIQERYAIELDKPDNNNSETKVIKSRILFTNTNHPQIVEKKDDTKQEINNKINNTSPEHERKQIKRISNTELLKNTLNSSNQENFQNMLQNTFHIGNNAESNCLSYEKKPNTVGDYINTLNIFEKYSIKSNFSSSSNNSEELSSKKSFNEKHSQTEELLQEMAMSHYSLNSIISKKDKKSLIEITLDNCYNEETLINLSLLGHSNSSLNTKLDQIITSIRQKTKHNEKLSIQIFEKLPLLLNTSINKVLVSLSSTNSSIKFEKYLVLKAFKIIINDLQMLIHTIPKCNYVSEFISQEIKDDLNRHEQSFIIKMNRLKAFVCNFKLKFEI